MVGSVSFGVDGPEHPSLVYLCAARVDPAIARDLNDGDEVMGPLRPHGGLHDLSGSDSPIRIGRILGRLISVGHRLEQGREASLAPRTQLECHRGEDH